MYVYLELLQWFKYALCWEIDTYMQYFLILTLNDLAISELLYLRVVVIQYLFNICMSFIIH